MRRKMDTLDSSFYHISELRLKAKMDSFMNQWMESCAIPEDWFSSDGFYPCYTRKHYKILIIGRESRGLGGRDYIKVLHHAYKGFDGKGQTIGGRPMNCHAFHRRIFYLVYGILNNFPDFNCLPKPNNLAIRFATKDGISFAFMEISKISNPDDNDSSSNWKNIAKSIKSATSEGHNFIRDEIELLAPDIIIGSGIWNLHTIIQHGNIEKLDNNAYLLKDFPTQNVSIPYEAKKHKNILYFPTYHFSARRFGDRWFYDHIGNLFKLFRCRL